MIRSLVYALVGFVSWPGLVLFNRIKIEGTEHLRQLPKGNVLFVSNHQTYFADVIAFLHIFCAVKWRRENRLGIPFYLLNPFTNVHFIAAEETMNGSLLSRIFKMAGALTVKRTWREKGKDVSRERDESDTQKIDEALHNSWIITFPQGTTKPFAPGRKGTAHIIKNNQPIVIPVVINGFWRAFTKTGLSFKKTGTQLTVRFKEPLVIDYTQPVDAILDQVMEAIEQSKSFMMKGRHHLMQMLDK
ncbi:MAG: lysophospholipid acyltransferase family protein [Sediminibacterium sp.]|jgi:1-acyl-sn-glycerol-3-phosphate acyltransferase|nr:1-acyl-sn-glycerol-3-phosphate acyltransferase [Chitinophagaceae bacterium]MCE2974070.1 1-acyl-sn-glycerol-3-phosphate acyltransferase [Sediminibacterium sp.]MCA6467492.1 1-acyl-sn-glycerol-3-phosphate acyltransferase [Chitinophagaceae bacterium]MCA6470828.1 1-acyl-sn-glycerol-3-phosphate acyltransferase [Chitinophagaceae bacterium]MCA6472759.1 1-acyl-sn-glycerol-3-phosphate acyltransferase [Chitinophagaceae bacterium]